MSEVLTVEEAAEYLRAHPKTVSAKLKSGVLPGRKVGRSYRIRRQDLDEYLSGKSTELPLKQTIQSLHCDDRLLEVAATALHLHDLTGGPNVSRLDLLRALENLGYVCSLYRARHPKP